MRKTSLFHFGIGIFSLLASAHSFAQQPSYLGIAGFQGSSEATYSFAGVIVPFNGGKVGEGPYYKAIASWLEYRYDSTQDNENIRIRARAPGIEAGVGYAWAGPSFGIDLSATIGYRNFSVRPFAPPGEPNGNVFTLNPQLQARYVFTPSIDADLISNYSIGQGAAFHRVRLGWKPEATWRAGIEGIRQRGENYRIQQHGLFAAKQMANGLSLEVSGGRAEAKDGSTSAYGGIGLAKVF